MATIYQQTAVDQHQLLLNKEASMKVSGMNGVAAKKINRQQVLRLLSLEPGISRTEIAQRMGLVKMTVSNIVVELLHSGMICETGSSSSDKLGAGRKLTGLRFSSSAPAVLGLWLSGRELHAALFSLELAVLERTTISISPETAVDQTADAVAGMWKTGRPLLAAGLALGAGWEFSLGIELSERLGIPVYTASNVAADAMVVSRYTGHRNYFCLSLNEVGPFPAPDAGLRGGIVVDGTLLGGEDGCTPLGRMVRGNAKLSDTASAAAICRRCSEQLGRPCRTLAEVQDACKGNPAAAGMLSDIFSGLVDIVCNLALAARPAALVMDGGLAGFGEDLEEYFFSRLHARLGEMAPIITPAHFGAENTMYGAACLVLERIFRGELGYHLFFPD